MPYILAEALLRAHETSVPLVAIQTADVPETTSAVARVLTEAGKGHVWHWDLVQGFVPLTEPARTFSQKGSKMTNPVEALTYAATVPGNDTGLPSAILCQNMHLLFHLPGVIQGILNLRDLYKGNNNMLVLIGSMATLPPELRHDVVVLEEPLPTAETLGAMVAREIQNFESSLNLDPGTVPYTPAEAERTQAALLGLSMFLAEQETAMALSEVGVNIGRLWERKRQIISRTPGLSVGNEHVTFADIGGYKSLVGFLRRVLDGQLRYRAVLWLDEVSDMLAGVAGDNTGVSQAFHSMLLTYLEEHKVQGALLYGVPGTGKSMVAKATGGEAQIPVICCNIPELKTKHVGASEANLSQVLKTIDAVAEGKVLLIGTTNDAAKLTPQFRRRFRLGTWFLDLPTKEEQEPIWQIHLARHPELGRQERPNSNNWTGADIAQVVDLAWMLDLPLVSAAEYIVPIAVSAKDQIQALRAEAQDQYLSASYPGVYTGAIRPERSANRSYSKR